MSSSRLLLAFGGAIGVLVIVAVVLVLTIAGAKDAPLLSEDTPEGTVQRYLLALKAEDYEQAYSYLSSTALTEYSYYEFYDEWSRPFSRRQESPGWKATLGKSSVIGDEATVDVVVDVFIFRPSGLFENPVRTQYITFHLKKVDASWSIVDPVWLWFFY